MLTMHLQSFTSSLIWFMKELNILADNVARNFSTRDLLQDTEDQFMKESNILADNVAKNFLTREVS